MAGWERDADGRRGADRTDGERDREGRIEAIHTDGQSG